MCVFYERGDENEMSKWGYKRRDRMSQRVQKVSITMALIKRKITSWIIEMKTTETENED